MTTSRDLLFVSLDQVSGGAVEQGDLSLALAGAEVIDLLGVEAVALDGDRIVPGHVPSLTDPLLDRAASSLVRDAPFESVGDWLWRRGRGLSAAYLAVLEAEGKLARRHRHGVPFGAGRIVPEESPDRSDAASRWASGEPVLVGLAAALGIRGGDGGEGEEGVGAADSPGVDDDALDTVLAAVHEALTQLEAVRLRRSVEQAAFDNIWRGE
ncbi:MULTISPECIES: GPP34 family phosphoprotein [unclassified Streptomyces]|uniref:GOLPH3/VPS74 family protein n=1 Tax=unclassified Streptomyces TaxID=2593676 RepID=UPI003701873D